MSTFYSERLRDPRWQKLRLLVMERDGWKCLVCGSEDKTLNVHHLVYDGMEPWDTPAEKLETLCEDCHEWREDWNRVFGRDEIKSRLAAVVMRFWKGQFAGKAFDLRDLLTMEDGLKIRRRALNPELSPRQDSITYYPMTA